MTYRITKANRTNNKTGYAGVCCEKSGVKSAVEYDVLKDALGDMKRLHMVNEDAIGFCIVENGTNRVVFGIGEMWDKAKWEAEMEGRDV